MNTLDLFSGLEGWSAPFRERGHSVVTLDLDPRFRADHVTDFLEVSDLGGLEVGGRFDAVLASPPCDTFSTGSFRHHWRCETVCRRCGAAMLRVGGERWQHDCPNPLPAEPYTYTPRTPAAFIGHRLMAHTFRLIAEYRPRVWVVENPRALMRKLAPTWAERRTVTWCQYGDTCMKPTDLWGGFPEGFIARACRNGDLCHEAAPRGAKTGTQGKTDAAARGKIPYGLALEVCIAAERGFNVVGGF